MNSLIRFKNAIKNLLFTVGISPLLSLVILLMHIAGLILNICSGASLKEYLYLLDGLLLSLMLCMVDFNVVRSPIQRQHINNIKKGMTNGQTENRPREDNPGGNENP